MTQMLQEGSKAGVSEAKDAACRTAPRQGGQGARCPQVLRHLLLSSGQDPGKED